MLNDASENTVRVLGGGVAGLNCAVHLHRRSIKFHLTEASDGLGGRMRTDRVDGFRLDRGFQVFQSAYPEAKAALNYDALDLRTIVPGALVRKGSKWVRMVDPIRYPSSASSTIFNSIGNLSDRWKLGKLLWDVWRTPMEQLTTADGDKSTRELLAVDYSFSESFLKHFMVPWLSGIFLETDLSTSANFFRFVIKTLSSGKVYYPRAGIQAIPDQLAGHLPKESIELNRPAKSVQANCIEFSDGQQAAKEVVIAVPMHQASQLVGLPAQDRGSTATTCIYFAADRPPIAEPILMLNGEQDGPVNHVFVMTNASNALAPAGKTLISVNLVGDAEYASDAVRSQLQSWFGSKASDWSELAVYRILQALPKQPAGFWTTAPTRHLNNTVLCGDYCASASLQGALLSGRMAAEQIALGKTV
jgi:phytoene dehydrogenase-like protein